MLFYENEPLRTQKLGVLASNQQNLTSVTLSLMISNIPLVEYSLFLKRASPKARIFSPQTTCESSSFRNSKVDFLSVIIEMLVDMHLKVSLTKAFWEKAIANGTYFASR